MNSKLYSTFARAFPAVLSLGPLVVFNVYWTSDRLAEIFSLANEWSQVLANVGISVPLFFLQIQLNRIASKWLIEDILFRQHLDFPTTRWLLWTDDKLGQQYKAGLHRQIRYDFGIALLDRETEKQDELEARRTANDAVVQIRKKIGNNAIVLQHNREYGFMRNLVGGAFVACIISIALFLFLSFNPSSTESRDAMTYCFAIYLLLIPIHRQLIRLLAESYATHLFREYYTPSVQITSIGQ